MRHELPHTMQVERVVDEAEGIKSVFFRARMQAKPGQFVMVWVPGVDAKPFGIAYLEDDEFGVTVCDVGRTSSGICRAKKGTLLGIMGPYGNSFSLQGKRIMLIGGGYGAATLFPLAEEAKRKGVTATFAIGARSGNALLYRERVKKEGINAVFTTDDGSFGRKGYATDVLEEALKAGGVDAVYGCGPELMLRRIAELCHRHGVPSQLSIERYMKCGFGVCGSCSVDGSGVRVCVEGTIFSGREALKISEFGKYHRDSSGTKHEFGK